MLYLGDTPSSLHNEILFHFSFVSAAHYYERYPLSLSEALAKIGGILGLINIGLFLQWIHSGKFDE
jgi:hypothetical protein